MITFLYALHLPFIIGGSSERKLKKSAERRNLLSIAAIAENPLSMRVTL